MMEEDFDKRLSDHIKAVFDDTGNSDADAGWALLREKHPPAGNRKPFVWFWWLAAALIISGVGFGLWQIEKKMGKDKTIKTIAKAHNDSARQHASLRPVNGKNQNTGRAAGPLAISNQQITAKKPQVNTITTVAPISYNTNKKHLVQHLKTNRLSKKGRHKTNTNKEDMPTPDRLSRFVIAGLPTNNSSGNTFNNNLLADGVSQVMIDHSELESAKLPADQPSFKQITNNQVQKEHLKLMAPGVFASAFYNSAKGSDNEFNLAGGGSLDLKLSQHWGLSTGLGVVHNTFTYAGYHAPGVYASSPGMTVVSSPSDELIAKITAIDIPLSLKYSFGSYNYISAGLSSFIYINEYSDQIQTLSSATATSFANQRHTIINRNFDGAGLFKTFDLSVAHGWLIGKKTVLLFEPFYKMSIGSQDLQNIKYNSTGITLKLNFQSAP